MKRACIIVLDSLGIGATEDADRFGEIETDTLGHIAEVCGKREIDNIRHGPLQIPNLTRLGLIKAYEGSTGKIPFGMDEKIEVIGAYAWAHQLSSGKDTLSGHWEIAGVPILSDWTYFNAPKNSFPKEFLDALVKRANLPGYLGNCHSSGTEILNLLGEEHIKTSKPIVYTSSDSVLQIACHEEFFGLDRLYHLCKISRELLLELHYNIGRVIARPFTGKTTGHFQRTSNRRDLVARIPGQTILQKLVEEKNGKCIAIGKVADIYDNSGITKTVRATGLDELFDATIQELKFADDKTIVFTNFSDFDSIWGHRRDPIGYASALEMFDRRLPELVKLVVGDDILILTADHGCDPTWTGTDHTREHIPVIVYGEKVKPGSLGHRETFADIGQTLAKYFSISEMRYGNAMF